MERPRTALATAVPPAKERPASAAPRRQAPALYPACPSIPLSYCLGQLRQGLEIAADPLSPEQVKALRRCELDIYSKALAFFSQDIAEQPTDLDVTQDHCAPDFLKIRAIEAARERLEP